MHGALQCPIATVNYAYKVVNIPSRSCALAFSSCARLGFVVVSYIIDSAPFI
jgi:uncharacterized membrane protein YdjX (TVP38/TMEM64 family)